MCSRHIVSWIRCVCTLESVLGSSGRRQPMRMVDMLMTPADTELAGLGSTPSSREKPNPVSWRGEGGREGEREGGTKERNDTCVNIF